jgi:outer membrane protein assembly factor BamB
MDMRIPGERSLHSVGRRARIVAQACALLALCVLSLSACSLPFFAPAHVPATKPAATHTPQPYSPLHYVTNGQTIYALDTATGAVRWQAPTAGTPSIWIVTPSVVYFRGYGIAALSATDGHLLWRRDIANLTEDLTADSKIALFFEYGKRVVAVNATTGVERWSWNTTYTVTQALILRDSILIQANHEYQIPCPALGVPGSRDASDLAGLYALDPLDGSVKWRIERSHEFGDGIVGVDGGLVFGATWEDRDTRCQSLRSSHFFAANLADGAPVWRYDGSGPHVGCEFANHAIYCIDDKNEMQVYRASDGSLLWRFGDDNIASAAFTVIAPHGVYLDVAYKDNPSHFLVALNTAHGVMVWTLQQPQTSLAHPDETVGVFQPFATSDGTIYGRGFHTVDRPKEILARDEATSQLKWMSDAYFAASVTFDQSVIYVDLGRRSTELVVPTGAVVALDAATGVILWEFRPPAS